jgi:hypothetical protein
METHRFPPRSNRDPAHTLGARVGVTAGENASLGCKVPARPLSIL